MDVPQYQILDISIHALLAESDQEKNNGHETTPYISIHALLAESDNGYPHTRQRDAISIHALLAESDAVLYRILRM